MIEFASWVWVSEGNLANTISGKLHAVQYFHRLKVGVELPFAAPVIQCAQKGNARAHVAAGTPRRVRQPVSLGVFLTGELLSLMGSGGEDVLAVSVSELFSTRTIGRDVLNRRPHGVRRGRCSGCVLSELICAGTIGRDVLNPAL